MSIIYRYDLTVMGLVQRKIRVERSKSDRVTFSVV